MEKGPSYNRYEDTNSEEDPVAKGRREKEITANRGIGKGTQDKERKDPANEKRSAEWPLANQFATELLERNTVWQSHPKKDAIRNALAEKAEYMLQERKPEEEIKEEMKKVAEEYGLGTKSWGVL